MKVARNGFRKYHVARVDVEGLALIVTLGADDPTELESEDANRVARRVAKRKGYRSERGRSPIAVYGQNNMAIRKFYYEKG